MIINKTWEIIYYLSNTGNNPVRDFIDQVRPDVKVKIFRIFKCIEEFGIQSVITHIKKLKGTPLWEIRVLGGDSVRILFITYVDRKIILLHAFQKKTQKTPLKEIQTALNRRKEYEIRQAT